MSSPLALFEEISAGAATSQCNDTSSEDDSRRLVKNYASSCAIVYFFLNMLNRP
jgi:hypothetical protein